MSPGSFHFSTRAFKEPYLLVKRFQLLVVYGGLSSLGGDVDDDADVALVLAQADVVAVDVLGGELVNRLRLGGISRVFGRLGQEKSHFKVTAHFANGTSSMLEATIGATAASGAPIRSSTSAPL